MLAAKKVIKTPFIVINADDYYGKEGFKAVHEYLVNGGKSCMAGFVLKNTLSDNGGVTRGICKMDEDNNLTEVVETKNIVKTADGAEVDGDTYARRVPPYKSDCLFCFLGGLFCRFAGVLCGFLRRFCTAFPCRLCILPLDLLLLHTARLDSCRTRTTVIS